MTLYLVALGVVLVVVGLLWIVAKAEEHLARRDAAEHRDQR